MKEEFKLVWIVVVDRINGSYGSAGLKVDLGPFAFPGGSFGSLGHIAVITKFNLLSVLHIRWCLGYTVYECMMGAITYWMVATLAMLWAPARGTRCFMLMWVGLDRADLFCVFFPCFVTMF